MSPRAVIMITDSGMLMGEVWYSSRRADGSAGGRVTSLLYALHRGGAALILPRHILEEVERAVYQTERSIQRSKQARSWLVCSWFARQHLPYV